jgi:Na+/melibiose symporter-like transporter
MKLNVSSLLVILGVDVMITIFCDFCQFWAKKLAFFSKTNVMIKILHNLALFIVKNANFFASFFCENIFKIITSVLGPLPQILSHVRHCIFCKKASNL